ncbi:MAG: VanZ family protein [Terriglobia bacterium]
MSKKASPDPSNPSHQRLLRWVVTLCWAGLVFDLSTAGFGTSFTSVMLHRLLALLRIRLSPAHFEVLHFLVRKSAHFTEYGILALLLYISLSGARRFDWRPRVALWSVVIAAVYSLTDEFHQIFVPDRGPSLKDCALDTTGALVAILLVRLFTRPRQGSKRSDSERPQPSAANVRHDKA